MPRKSAARWASMDDPVMKAVIARGSYTLTSKGPIPHRKHPVLGIECPVALDIASSCHDRRIGQTVADPEIDVGGHYIYVLPGGSRWRPGNAGTPPR